MGERNLLLSDDRPIEALFAETAFLSRTVVDAFSAASEKLNDVKRVTSLIRFGVDSNRRQALDGCIVAVFSESCLTARSNLRSLVLQINNVSIV